LSSAIYTSSTGSHLVVVETYIPENRSDVDNQTDTNRMPIATTTTTTTTTTRDESGRRPQDDE
jgi:hypothetical protein